MNETNFKGVWAVVAAPGGKWMGEVFLVDPDEGEMKAPNNKQEVLTALVRDRYIALSPAIDYFLELGGQPPNLSKIPLTLPFDFTLHEMPVYTKPSMIFFFDDMHEKDADGYKRLVTSALDLAKAATRAESSGLVVSSRLPQGMRPPGRG